MFENRARPIAVGPKTHGDAFERSLGARLPADIELVEGLVRGHSPNLAKSDFDFVVARVFSHLHAIRLRFPTRESIQGKRILDLACGSTAYRENNRGSHDPWMPRLLLKLGAHPVGVDAEGQAGERFEFHKADLLRCDALSFLETASLDSYYVKAFPPKKTIEAISEYRLNWPSIRDNLLLHLNRALKPGCLPICTFDETTERFVQEHYRPPPPPHWRRFLEDDDF